MENRRQILDNELFTALEEVGHKPEDDVFVWSQGLAFHYQNLVSSLEDKVSAVEQEAILTDIWSFVKAKAEPRVSRTLGLDTDQDPERLKALTATIMQDAEHPAILGMGDTVEEAILLWVRAFAILDFAMYTFLEKHLGSKRCMDIYMGLWESFAVSNVDHVKEALGIHGPDDIDMDTLGEVSRVYWESIACPYRVTKHSEDVHEAEIQACPYFVNMTDILGTEQARSMTLKCEAVVSVNYYDAILKALGVFDRYSFTMDKFICCGDDVCRVRFEKRK
ncbi:MAG: hypothetical protein V1912_07145 [bacterium]